MEKHFYTFILFVASLFFIGCDDNDQWLPGDIPGKGEIAVYTNKPGAAIGANELVLNYSGQPFIGKEVQFGQDRNGKGWISLYGILPGETETKIDQITLIPHEKGYTFQGNGEGVIHTAFKYSGQIEKSRLTFNLSEIKIPANLLADQGTWKVVKTGGKYGELNQTDSIVQTENGQITYQTQYLTGNGKGLMMDLGIFQLDMGSLIGMMAGNLINSVVKDITFHADGRITATYAGFPEGANLLEDLMNTGVKRREDEWKPSPDINLASYYMQNDSVLYVRPNVDMIIRQIEQEQTQTKAGDKGFIPAVADVYKMLNAWTTNGIRLIVKEQTDGSYIQEDISTYTQYEGDMYISLKAEELQPVIELLDNLPESIRNIEVDMLGSPTKIGDLLNLIKFTPDFKIWLYFNK